MAELGPAMTRRQAVLEAEGKVHRVGRNEQCPCGSGKKYKHCYGA